MPDIILSDADRRRIEQTAQELDQVIEEFFGDDRAALPAEDWDLLMGYVKACVRRAAEIGVLLDAIVTSQGDIFEYPGRGRDVFVRHALAAWKDSFAPVAEVWRLGPVFAAVAGGERRVLADVATLEAMVANRVSGSLDERYRGLLAEDR
jgi:hypothetical protein